MAVKTENKKFDYHFKKEKIKNADGATIGEGKKHPSIAVELPVPTAEGIVEIVAAGGKGLELLLDVMADAIFGQGRNLINAIRGASPDAEVKPEMLDLSKLDWEFIANMPKAERKGLGISDEDFDSFFEDYRAIMPKVTGKDLDRIEKHVSIFKKKLGSVKNDKKALSILRDMLLLWAGNTSAMEENQEVYDYLLKRSDTLLAEEEKVLAEAL